MKNKTIKAWAVISRRSNIETDSARMPIYWLKEPAKRQAEKYYDIPNGESKIMEVTISY